MNIELLLLSYAGILLHYLLKLKDAADKGVVSELFQRNAIVRESISIITSVVSASIIVYVREDIASIFVVTPVGAVIAGYAGQSILNKILGAKMPAQLQANSSEVTTTINVSTTQDVVGDGTRPPKGPK